MYIYAFIGSGPDKPLPVLIPTPDKITPDAGRVFGIMPENFEPVTFKAIQTVDGSEPQESIFILKTADYTVIGQSILNMVMLEIIVLCI